MRFQKLMQSFNCYHHQDVQYFHYMEMNPESLTSQYRKYSIKILQNSYNAGLLK